MTNPTERIELHGGWYIGVHPYNPEHYTLYMPSGESTGWHGTEDFIKQFAAAMSAQPQPKPVDRPDYKEAAENLIREVGGAVCYANIEWVAARLAGYCEAAPPVAGWQEMRKLVDGACLFYDRYLINIPGKEADEVWNTDVQPHIDAVRSLLGESAPANDNAPGAAEVA